MLQKEHVENHCQTGNFELALKTMNGQKANKKLAVIRTLTTGARIYRERAYSGSYGHQGGVWVFRSDGFFA